MTNPQPQRITRRINEALRIEVDGEPVARIAVAAVTDHRAELATEALRPGVNVVREERQ